MNEREKKVIEALALNIENAPGLGLCPEALEAIKDEYERVVLEKEKTLSVLCQLVHQFGGRLVGAADTSLFAAGVPALEEAFALLNANGCALNVDGSLSAETLYSFMPGIDPMYLPQ